MWVSRLSGGGLSGGGLSGGRGFTGGGFTGGGGPTEGPSEMGVQGSGFRVQFTFFGTKTEHNEGRRVRTGKKYRKRTRKNKSKKPREKEETEQTPSVRLRPINFDFGQFRLRPTKCPKSNWPKSSILIWGARCICGHSKHVGQLSGCGRGVCSTSEGSRVPTSFVVSCAEDAGSPQVQVERARSQVDSQWDGSLCLQQRLRMMVCGLAKGPPAGTLWPCHVLFLR